MPNGRCRLHGGKSLAPGPLHPRWQTGRYSKLVRDRPQQTDPERLSLVPDIEALDALIDDLVTDVAEHSPATPEELRVLARLFRDGPPDRKAVALVQLLDAIEASAAAEPQRRQLRQLIIDRAGLAAKERQLRIAEARTITEAEYVAAIIRVTELLDEVVTDETYRQRLASELAAIAERRPGEALPAALGEPEFIIDSAADA